MASDADSVHGQEENLIQRLHALGVPVDYFNDEKMGLVGFVRENRGMLPAIVRAILPPVEEAENLNEKRAWNEYKQGYRKGIKWVQWLMFEGDPDKSLEEIGHVRGVCGAVWGQNDIAYRCRTCENDPTCAICVPCFDAGNHHDHDYSMIHTGGGCCDCGDITAWKESGFCSNHRGPGQVPSLAYNLLFTFEPVMEALLLEWAYRLQAAAAVANKRAKRSSQSAKERAATQTSAAIVALLLKYCNYSESLLSFIGSIMASEKINLLDILLKSECFLPEKVIEKLHELLFKLMGDPKFKYHFAKAFVQNYPDFIRDILSDVESGASNSRSRVDSALNNFSVQIFTVPTLTPQLVVDMKLLDILLNALKDVLLCCAGEDGQIVVGNGPLTKDFYIRTVEDIRFVMRHPEVTQYVAQERRELYKSWLSLLAYTQCMDPQKRLTNIHVEEETDSWLAAYKLEVFMSKIHPLFIDGASKKSSATIIQEKRAQQWIDISCRENIDVENIVHGHAKIGRISEDNELSRKVESGSYGMDIDEGGASTSATVSVKSSCVPSALLWLIAECARFLEIWLLLDTYRTEKADLSMQKEDALPMLAASRVRGGRAVTRDSLRNYVDIPVEGRMPETGSILRPTFKDWLRSNRHVKILEKVCGTDDFGGECHLNERSRSEILQSDSEDWWMGSYFPGSDVRFGYAWNDKEWLEISFDVSQQGISLHIPLHRFMSIALRESIAACSFVDQQESKTRNWFSVEGNTFLQQLFPPHYQVASFASLLMEHPLRIQVFCAQCRAGMWRRNGHSVQALNDNYVSVRWCEDSSDLDLYLLQCCAVMAPPEDYVNRIVARFGLADYFSLSLLPPNEYETTLAQYMLSLLIRIVVERGFSGFTDAQSCRRELIRRLTISDATHSQLMKSLPSRFHENKQWEELLPAVSTYSKPSGMQQGKFSLRDECWKELDLYHPRSNAKELQCAEDRYFHRCKESAVTAQLPRWTKPFFPFEGLSRIATCEKVYDIIHSILFHAVNSERITETRVSEPVLITALHLLALGLDTCSLFSYDGSFDKNSSGLHNDFNIGFRPSDSETQPPLLSKIIGKRYLGGNDRTEMSDQPRLISLLVLLMQKFNKSDGVGGGGESHQANHSVLIKKLLLKLGKLHEKCWSEIESLAPEILDKVSIRDSLAPLNLTESEKRKLLAREHQAAMMAKMKAAQDKFALSIPSMQEGKVSTDELQTSSRRKKKMKNEVPPVVVCALCRDSSSDMPTSLLTFIQRSNLLAIAMKGIPSWDVMPGTEVVKASTSISNRETDESDAITDESQTRADLLNLIQMSLTGEVDPNLIQTTFNGEGDLTGVMEVGNLRELLGDEGNINNFLEARISETSGSDSGINHFIQGEEDDGVEDSASSSFDSVGMQPVSMQGEAKDEDPNFQEAQNKYLVNVLVEYCSIIVRKHRHHPQPEVESLATEPLQTQQRHRYTGQSRVAASERKLLEDFGSDDNIGMHMSSCGHAVHKECLDRYLSSLMQRYRSRTFYEGLQIVDPEQGEFLCPVCRRLANSILPYYPENMRMPSFAFEEVKAETSSISMDAEMGNNPYNGDVPEAATSYVSHAITLLHNAEELVWKVGFRKAISKPILKSVKAVFDSLFSTMCGLYFPQRGGITKSNYWRVSQSMLLWDVLRYTMMSAELAARHRKGYRQDSLFEVLKVPVLQSLLWAAKSTQSQCRQSVLLRARGVQLLVGSVCLGVSKDSLTEPFIPGNIARIILSRTDSGQVAADMKFWKHVADPVLAHDPFSSLVWTVFCLPSFPSSGEPFVALVHIFYLVCLVQVLVFMGEILLSNLSELQLSNSTCSFLEALLTKIPESSMPGKYELHIHSKLVFITARTLTLPYLRRCALFRRLLINSGLEDAEGRNLTNAVNTSKIVDWTRSNNNQDFSKDSEEVEILEKQFGIRPLQQILESAQNQKLVLKWCQHLFKDYGVRKLLPIPKPVRASPFKLMDLPPLYQTLLQRFIREICPNCLTVPKQPALCLLCGTLCCSSIYHGAVACRCVANRQNECYKHAMTCGAGVGVFLMIRMTNILLQRNSRQAIWPSPYLDDFGEEDIEMVRGKPLYLNEERYAALASMVAMHGLDHSSMVLSRTTWEAFI